MITVSVPLPNEATKRSHWDRIDFGALLHLEPARRTTDEFGFLLRHYWIPASELIYESSRHQISPGNAVLCEDAVLSRRMLKCDSDVCLWRETPLERKKSSHENFVVGGPEIEHLCVYNRAKQSFQTRFTLAEHERFADGPGCVFLKQTVLTPLLPVPVGFRWHVANGSGQMDFHLEAHPDDCDTSVLLIRRRGRFSLHSPNETGSTNDSILYVEREGVTALAQDRSLVLEDRTRDQIHIANSQSPIILFSTLKLAQISPI